MNIMNTKDNTLTDISEELEKEFGPPDPPSVRKTKTLTLFTPDRFC